ncbi:MAG: LPS export ABC transporter periplasmic protein LptC [Pseudomonadota bacterium]
MTADQTAETHARETSERRQRSGLPSGRRNVRINPLRRPFVNMLKLVLPMIAAGLLALVLLWPQIEKVQKSGFRLGFSTSPEDLMENVAMANARFFGVDGNRQPFTVTAIEAIEQPANDQLPKHMHLETPQADMTMEDGSWVAITAEEGFYIETQEQLDLVGEVNMYHDRGFEIHTRRAEIYLARGNASGTDPVDGQGPFGTINSDSGFELEDKGAVIRFLGNATLVIFDSALEGQ